LASLGNPRKFQRVSRLRFVTAATSLTAANETLKFARCLAVFWASTLYIHFRWLLPLYGILSGTKSPLCASLAFSCQRYCTALQQRRQPNFVGWYKKWNYVTFADGGHLYAHILVVTFLRFWSKVLNFSCTRVGLLFRPIRILVESGPSPRSKVKSATDGGADGHHICQALQQRRAVESMAIL